jgi:hypothetical protein
VKEEALGHRAEVEVGVARTAVTSGALVLAQVKVGAPSDPTDDVAVAGDKARYGGKGEKPAQRARS